MTYCYAHRLAHLKTLTGKLLFAVNGDQFKDSTLVKGKRVRGYRIFSNGESTLNTLLPRHSIIAEKRKEDGKSWKQ